MIVCVSLFVLFNEAWPPSLVPILLLSYHRQVSKERSPQATSEHRIRAPAIRKAALTNHPHAWHLRRSSGLCHRAGPTSAKRASHHPERRALLTPALGGQRRPTTRGPRPRPGPGCVRRGLGKTQGRRVATFPHLRGAPRAPSALRQTGRRQRGPHRAGPASQPRRPRGALAQAAPSRSTRRSTQAHRDAGRSRPQQTAREGSALGHRAPANVGIFFPKETLGFPHGSHQDRAGRNGGQGL